MKSIVKLFCIICSIIFFGMILVGCSKKGEEAVGIDTKTAEELSGTEDKAATEQASDTEDTASTEEPSATEASGDVVEETSNSPWKLVSESSVTTKVNYAGFLDDKIGVTVGYAGEISYTEDGGKTWSKSSNTSACRYGLDLYNEAFIVSSGNSGVNLLSKDKGRTWYRMGDFPLKSGTAYNKFVSIIDNKNLYVGAIKALAYSSDGAVTFNEVSIPEGCNKIASIFFLTVDTGYVLSAEGNLYKTTDGCKTWTSQTIEFSDKFLNNTMPSVAMNFQDEDHGMIVYATRNLTLGCIKTEDGGATWTTVEMPKTSLSAPYLSRDGQYLTLCAATRKVALYKYEDQ